MTIQALVPSGWSSSLLPSHIANDDLCRRSCNEVDRRFSRDFRTSELGTWPECRSLASPIELAETPDAFELVVDLPGIDPKDATTELQGDVLTIRGEKKAEHEERRATWQVSERRYRSFVRSMRLPFQTEADEIEAASRNGVSTVTVPKPAALRPEVEWIEVKAAA